MSLKEKAEDAALGLAKEVYSDALSPALREAAKIGEDAVKVIRLAIFPLQFLAATQDRVAAYIDQAIRKVPENRRIAPPESLIRPVAEKLRFQEEDSSITRLYVNLLSRAVDRERIGEAHPAFIQIVGQVAPDEVMLIEQLAEKSFRAFVGALNQGVVLSRDESAMHIARSRLDPEVQTALIARLVESDRLAQPEHFKVLLEHLVSLGIVEFTNEAIKSVEFKARSSEYEYLSNRVLGLDCWFIQLTSFGKLFHLACVGEDSPEQSM